MGRPGPERFAARSTLRNGVARIALQGELDLATVRVVVEHLDLVAEGASEDGDGMPDVIIDLRAVTFMDSTGLRTILDAARSASERGVRFAAVGVDHHVRKVFEITGTVDSLNELAALGLLQRFSSSNGDAPS